MKLKDIIKAKRIEKKYSQVKLAKTLGYSSGQFVSNWERGESYPPMDRLAKIALIFEIEKEYLIDLFLKEYSDLKRKEYLKAYGFHEYNMKSSK
ncbi:MAG: helix-turn-helix domain-containing protein [Bdellovibrionales bacterium]